MKLKEKLFKPKSKLVRNVNKAWELALIQNGVWHTEAKLRAKKAADEKVQRDKENAVLLEYWLSEAGKKIPPRSSQPPSANAGWQMPGSTQAGVRQWWQTEDENGKVVPTCRATLEAKLAEATRAGHTGRYLELCGLPQGHTGKHGKPGQKYEHPKRKLTPIVVHVKEAGKPAPEQVLITGLEENGAPYTRITPKQPVSEEQKQAKLKKVLFEK